MCRSWSIDADASPYFGGFFGESRPSNPEGASYPCSLGDYMRGQTVIGIVRGGSSLDPGGIPCTRTPQGDLA